MPTIYHYTQPIVVDQARYDLLITRPGYYAVSTPKVPPTSDKPPGGGTAYDLAQLTGVVATKVPMSLVDAKGDLLVGTANDTVGRLALGTNGQALIVDTSQTAGMVWATPVDVQGGTVSGTWTNPSPLVAKPVLIQGHSAGSGGGSGRRGAAGTLRTAGGGGAAGIPFQAWALTTDFPATVNYTVGAGGAGGAAPTVDDTDGNAGVAGGNTVFGATFTALRIGAVNSPASAGGRGGSAVLAAGGASAQGGVVGGSGVASGVAGSNGSAGSLMSTGGPLMTGTAGGGGGGLTAANAEAAGGAGGVLYGAGVGGGVAGAPGGAGTRSGGNGLDGYSLIGGVGGGGGASAAGSNAGAGGNGGFPGGGGGGGAALVNGFNALGPAGNGSGGIIRITTFIY